VAQPSPDPYINAHDKGALHVTWTQYLSLMHRLCELSKEDMGIFAYAANTRAE